MKTILPQSQEKEISQNTIRVSQSVAIIRQMPMVLIGNILTGAVAAIALDASYSFIELLPLILGIMILFFPVAQSWLRLRRRPVPLTVSRRRILKLTIHSGLIGLFWAICMLYYLPGIPADLFGLLITGCGFLAAGSVAVLYTAPIACLLYSVPIMGVSLYLTIRSGFPQTVLLIIEVMFMVIGIGWMLHANWRNFQDLVKLSKEKELDMQKVAQQMRDRSEFLENCSHEIRNSLTSIIGFTNLLQNEDRNLQSNLRQYAKNISNGAEALRVHLNDVLDMARMDNNHLEIKLAPIQIKALLDDITSLISLEANAKKLPIHVSIGPEVPGWLLADAYRLKQVLFNLLSNAIKFTHHGHVDITVTWESGYADQGSLTVKVADTGPGIPQGTEHTLFKRFTKLNESRSREGAGLGLFISQQLISKMGGELKTNSEKGYGAVFIVQLILCKVAGLSTTTSYERSSTLINFPKNILIADDLPSNRDLIRIILAADGHNVSEASDGTFALNQCALQKFDMIFMDINMPHLDGLMATKLIRRQCVLNFSTPVIAVTGYINESQANEFKDAGINDHLLKPLTRKELLTKVEIWGATDDRSSSTSI